MYRLIKKLLFAFPPETAHWLALNLLDYARQLNLTALLAKPISQPISLMGLHFSNSIGLAAGLDKNADYLAALSTLGFGFIEIGTVTPKPQPGNPKPRLFRLPQQEAIINRLGFNSKGAVYVAKRLEKFKNNMTILGINLGKNRDTPLEYAVDDYIFGMQTFWQYADYFVINISSPNTPGLRELQKHEFSNELLAKLKAYQQVIALKQNKYVPLVIKISPDLTTEEVQSLAQQFLQHEIDGVIACNTTINRENLSSSWKNETGGLSGRPLNPRSTEVIANLQAILQSRIPIIASGGMMSPTDLQAKQKAGANLFQIYTGFIYRGPKLIGELVRAVRT